MHSPKLTVFAGSAGALILSSAIGVVAGSFIAQHVRPQVLSWLAGLSFIVVGIWMILRA